MTPQDIQEMFARTLDDYRLSRGERSALDRVFDDVDPNQQQLAQYRSIACDLARAAVVDPQAKAVVDWLEDVMKLLAKQTAAAEQSSFAEAYFSPDEKCPRRIASLLAAARQAVDICVFTITDDRISAAILDAHRRGVAVRILTDDDKAEDRGSDIVQLGAAGVPVRVDNTPHHMHHKFALFDSARLLTGSYNWTRSAADKNQDNFIVTDDRRLVAAFTRVFTRLWESLA